MSDNTVFVVIDGLYDPSIEAIYDSEHEDAARRYAKALRDGSYYSVSLNHPNLIKFQYRIDYSTEDDTALCWLDMKSKWFDGVKNEEPGYYTTLVSAESHGEAESFGREKIMRFIAESSNG